MSGNGPSFGREALERVYVDDAGLEFEFDFGFPHVVQACSPEVDLSVVWAEARPYLNPAGPLAGY
jgi:hypothetical protein